ncbi:hypothetical protein A1O3_10189 [Capronia epimyces CBS 606.96]|uniref:Zn(2)-C6 fungal-type domain-containing protein n=1 Tax=Capronia epimyces CBS 606.96 TaxID=1182542 RepID=W9X990_9EURO|nr:uncharacterized protein A1O3_10189 [Capronia epimyces CBS 606.96]EXJ77032.1 hypothetical protein A1O3_10189 [Capronia epimyces CBS 606.96]
MSSPPRTRPLKPAKDGQPSKPSIPKKRQASARISAACEACKKRKTKCTGGPAPCQLCVSLGTECIIDLSLDMRRRAALQRTLDESRIFQDTLNVLLGAIRGGPSARLDALFEYIRSGASSDDIATAIHSQWNSIEDQDLDQVFTSGADEMEEPLLDGSAAQLKALADSVNGNPTHEELETQKREAFRLGSVGSDSRRGRLKNRVGLFDMSRLVAALKTCTPADGEELLRQFLASRFDDKISSNPGSGSVSSGMSSSDGVVQQSPYPSMVERSQWHPALQARSESNRSQQQVHVGSLSRRAVETNPMSHTSSYTSSSSLGSAKLQSSPQPVISTDMLMVPDRAISPTVPYLEPIQSPTASTCATNIRDLCVAQEHQATRLRIPPHLVLPLTVNDDSYMSRTYSHYLQAAQQMLEAGVPPSDIMGPTAQVVVDLFFRPRSASDKFDCASWACEVCRSYDHDVFVRLASVFMLASMMRWLLVPTPELYQRIPDMMKPTPSQCMIPHIGAIETIPLPPVRDAVIHRLRDWLTPLVRAGWSVNWQYGLDAAIERDPATGSTVLTADFIEHVSDYNNWSVARSFLEDFPEVVGQIRIHES